MTGSYHEIAATHIPIFFLLSTDLASVVARLKAMPDPLYTPDNCRPAYQLRWSLALFATDELPESSGWLEPLQSAVEKDGVRILEFQSKPRNVNFFLVSTQPIVAPSQIIKSVKGRLQHCIRECIPKAFRRNYWLTSLGDARQTVVEEYVASQLDHLHATLGCAITESPQEVALSYMNNLAFAHGMKSIFSYGYYVGTFGEYDMGAIRL